MFIYICVILSFPYSSCVPDLMSVLWEEEDHILKTVMTGQNLISKETTKFIKRLSQLPFTEHIKSEAWYKLLKDRSIEDITPEEWEMYEALIPFLPPELLLSLNFTNEKILEYFGTVELKPNQLSLIAEKLTFLLNSDIMQDPEKILKLKNIFCGFSAENMERINAQAFRFLLEKNFFKLIKGCRIEQLTALKYVAQKYPTIGPPRTWSPEILEALGIIVAGLNGREIRSIRRRCFSRIMPDVIKITPEAILKKITNDQLMALNKSALLTWRRETKDLRILNMATKIFPIQSFLIVALMALHIC